MPWNVVPAKRCNWFGVSRNLWRRHGIFFRYHERTPVAVERVAHMKAEMRRIRGWHRIKHIHCGCVDESRGWVALAVKAEPQKEGLRNVFQCSWSLSQSRTIGRQWSGRAARRGSGRQRCRSITRVTWDASAATAAISATKQEDDAFIHDVSQRDRPTCNDKTTEIFAPKRSVSQKIAFLFISLSLLKGPHPLRLKQGRLQIQAFPVGCALHDVPSPPCANKTTR